MDYEIWIDLSKMTPGDWIGVSCAALVVLWVILVLVKLALSWPGADDDPEPMQMDAPEPNVVDQGRLYIIDRTGGESLRASRRPYFEEQGEK